LALTRPTYFLPVHGEHRMLVRHAQTAQSMGIPADHMVIVQNGDIVEVDPSGIRIAGQVPSGVELVDSSRLGVVGRDILKDRQQLAEDGVVTIAATLGSNGQLAAEPAVQLRGVAHTVNPDRLQQAIKQVLNQVLETHGSELIVKGDRGQPTIDWEGLKSLMERDLRRLLRRELDKRDPMLILLLQGAEVETAQQPRRSSATAAAS
ncbi:MAG TPA: ribonuclease J, partial [Leptolyngbyaceae cyanobacterium M65_K2018_010]|nr:ribonuclease J [Leptolyngbyaceae cyanobacterium M65_K2018_010]